MLLPEEQIHRPQTTKDIETHYQGKCKSNNEAATTLHCSDGQNMLKCNITKLGQGYTMELPGACGEACKLERACWKPFQHYVAA